MLNFVLSGDCNANWPLDAANCPLTSDWWATEGGAINKDKSERFAPQTDNEGLGSDNRNVLYFPTWRFKHHISTTLTNFLFPIPSPPPPVTACLNPFDRVWKPNATFKQLFSLFTQSVMHLLRRLVCRVWSTERLAGLLNICFVLPF